MPVAIESFDRHGLRAQNDKLIDIPDMTTILHSLYVTIDQIDLPLMLDLAINWILNVYDSQRTGQIRVLSFKVKYLCIKKKSFLTATPFVVLRSGWFCCAKDIWKRNIVSCSDWLLIQSAKLTSVNSVCCCTIAFKCRVNWERWLRLVVQISSHPFDLA